MADETGGGGGLRPISAGVRPFWDYSVPMSTAPKLPADETLVNRRGESIAELGGRLTELKSRVEENSRMIASLIAARVAEMIQPR